MTKLNFLDPNPSGTPAVLLLHGLGATGDSWRLQLPVLTEIGFRPIAPDAPGFGDSPYDGNGWNPARVAVDLADLLGELGTGPAHIVGLSMGGVIAQQFSHDFPHLTRKLILASTFSVLRPDTIGGWFYFLRRIFAVIFLGMHAQAHVVAERIFPNPEQAALREMLVTTISSADARAYRGAMRALGMFDSRKWLAQLECPTLVVTGTVDSTVPLKVQRRLADDIPGARQVIVDGAGHAIPIDRTEEFNKILKEFLCNP
jgi:pimeloyl-ACP methyl ester carboxylesterase